MTLFARRSRLIRRNVLTYPGTKAGFNPQHIAGAVVRFSAVPTMGTISPIYQNLTNLLNGQPGTNTQNPTVPSIDGSLGPVYRHNNATVFVDFAGMPAVTDTQMTFGWIWRPHTINACAVFSTDSAAAGGVYVGLINPAHIAIVANGGSFKGATTNIVADGIYFHAISMDGSNTTNFLQLDLSTGAITTSTTTGTPTTASGGTYRVGRNSAVHLADGRLATIMYAAKYMSMTALLQWASDPWSFWYPRL